ncbi:MAG: hypothetical protein H6668_16995 [Ardenticatenaceae bacterium]|nr:hypothetical protein [Ardenticatenaceae bacterium]
MTTISLECKKRLLQTFEPVLRFSHGERFFPMRVEDYVANCKLKQHRDYCPEQDQTDQWITEARPLAPCLNKQCQTNDTNSWCDDCKKALANALGNTALQEKNYLLFLNQNEHRGSLTLIFLSLLIIFAAPVVLFNLGWIEFIFSPPPLNAFRQFSLFLIGIFFALWPLLVVVH